MKALLLTYRPHFSIAILVILYVVGIVGLGSSSREWFLAATPLTLVISAGLLLANHLEWNRWAVSAVVTAAIVGFLVEVVGVQTGLIFGEYAYGATLGAKLWAVPLVIGLNWLLLTYTTGALTARLRLPKVLQAALAAAAMTALDVLIEPIAMAFDFWQWPGGVVPMQNYIAWFLVSFALLLLFQYLRFDKRNPLAAPVLALQVLFFGILNLML
ncbi:MAG: carotenoid biosynthesis protein [Bacteroidetes bacterium]|nr:carotenoid biosynthesis protein [Bacteroidota bacterium]MBP6640572.1 carotenoid biosynthesis protein [Bacteroidia bacterium]